MSLDILQQVLARLYTDTEFRQRFFDNPEIIGQEFCLNAEQVQQLQELRSPQINFFARSLQQKRLQAACSLLPLTYRALESQFSQLFGQYAPTYTPGGIKKHRQDAVMFCNFLSQIAALDSPWMRDLAEYEKGWLLTTEPQFRWHRCRLHYNLAPFLQSGSRQLQRQNAIALWIRLSPSAKTHYFQLPWF
ncbi:MAG: hypothetical protein SAJ12_11110 [Jaaginema sp. PMC 1079.18]|nr:hypothetical protein [Jaaginema sp. PMC 1080.18]MEC4851551.1 hypothetical protein [Jaaginema sp. PMC 1079.18]MEC4865304.1 hypothetical protein [Jaaginema sp. PMC 1078.18]